MQDMPVAIVEQAQENAAMAFETGALAELYVLPEGFVYLDEAAPGICWDAKYATEDNFTGQIVSGYRSNRIALSQEAAQGLIEAQALAREKGYQLLIWDAARPQRAVDCFVAWSEAPEDLKTKAAHYPRLEKSQLFGEYIAKRSGHSRGGAVDLTLLTLDGEELDMGGGFDLMDERSHHGAKGITKAQTRNRNTLKAIMEEAGFKPYASEWWHYSLTDEPYPKTYFDFVIGGKAAQPAEEPAAPSNLQP